MQLQNETHTLALRPLERQDLRFVHELNNDAKIMRYWFEEPYETFAELSQLVSAEVILTPGAEVKLTPWAMMAAFGRQDVDPGAIIGDSSTGP
ncbi:hypothetical protein QZM03_28895, partial [Burkholderia multivorans]|nr:hypothetical protein [Burkholderia multivorans]